MNEKKSRFGATRSGFFALGIAAPLLKLAFQILRGFAAKDWRMRVQHSLD